MQFRILGPLEVLHDGDRLQLGGVRRRAVLARLLLCPGRAVGADRLIDDVWAEQPPATARKNLQKYVSELRSLLPAPVLVTTPGGYLLDVPPEAVDAQRFESLVDRAEFTDALDLWRGEVLADLPAYGFVVAERARLEEARMLAWQARVAADLDAGLHEQAVGELAEAVGSHPHRDRLVELYMLALYRSGRQGEALAAFQAHRDRLANDLGVEPGSDLRDLQVSILRQGEELRPPAGPLGNLPRALTSFVGRVGELAAVGRRLRGNRLVTLTGPGGVGKTRLAVEAAGRTNGAWLVDLAEVRVAEQVPTAVATALRIDVRHAPDAATGVEARLLGSGPTVVVLDNCEHVVDACSTLLRRLLRTCPALTVLATSRRPLGVEGEYVLPLASLGEDDAVRLFVERGQLTGQLSEDGWSVEDVAAVCRGLDGLPLAIELAASQLRVLSMAELASRMDRRLSFHAIADERSPRQGTLRDMVAWSCDLIPAETQQVFARCGVFLGSLSLDGAEAVCADLGLTPDQVLDHVTMLVDHSLLLRVSGSGADSRYRLLETLRLFALDLLAASDAVEIACRAHAAYVRSVADRAGRRINGPDELVWQRRMEVEAPNVEVALGWAAEHDWSLAADLAVALWPYWDAGWGERSGIAYVERLLAVDPPPDPERRAWALVVAADLAANQGDARKAVPWAREALRSFPDGSRPGRGQALVALGGALGSEGGLHEAGEVLDEALRAADRQGDEVLAARALNRRHFVAARQGDHAAAEDFGRRELARWAEVGSARGHATALRHLAVTAFRFGDLDYADALCEQALGIWRDMEDPAAVAHVQTTLGDIARERGDVSRATALYRAALVDLQAIGDRRCEASTCKNLATILAVEDAHEQSAHLYREGISLRHELGDQVGLAECFEGLAASLRGLSRDDECVTLLGAAAALRSTHESLATEGEQRAVDALASAARQELGSGRFEASWARGSRMRLDEAVELALDRVG
jgi:predicted ATPase/DNA-binding SARP family transcriptional activator